MAILDGLVVDPTQVVGSQEVLQVEQVNITGYRSEAETLGLSDVGSVFTEADWSVS